LVTIVLLFFVTEMAHRMARHCNPELAVQKGHQRIAQVWSFELKALEARFGSAVTQSQVEGAMASIEVDLSHMLKKPKGSVSIVATVPHDYPRKRPELKARDPENAIDPELMEELVQCGATALQSAFAASGPAVFFAVDQVAALLRKRFKGEEPLRGSQVRGAEGELTRTEETRVADKPRRRRRRRSAASLVLPLLNAEKEEVVESREEEKFGGEPVSFGRSKGGGSWSTGISTPSCISEEQSSSSSSSSDSSSESSSSGMSDDEMQRIAAQLHFNVRRQMLFKPPSRGKERR